MLEFVVYSILQTTRYMACEHHAEPLCIQLVNTVMVATQDRPSTMLSHCVWRHQRYVPIRFSLSSQSTSELLFA